MILVFLNNILKHDRIIAIPACFMTFSTEDISAYKKRQKLKKILYCSQSNQWPDVGPLSYEFIKTDDCEGKKFQ